MKTLLTSVLAAGVLAGAAVAIPQTFGNGFFGSIGKPFEDVAVAAVAQGGEMKGTWAPVRGKEGTQRLDMTAVVFGVQASEVTEVKSGNGAAKYHVLYRAADDKKRGKQNATLRERVESGIRTYTGAEVKGPVTYKGARVTLEDGAKGDVSVEIAKAP